METLGDAWEWYQSARDGLTRLQRIGRKHWAGLSVADVSLWRDDQFKNLSSPDIEGGTGRALAPLADLGVLVLFSVFESIVRRRLEADVARHAAGLGHAILVQAAADALDGIRQGSFAANVLTPLKDQGQVSAELAEEVRQVREYRNWVGHGRGSNRPAGVTPRDAYDRLRRFLDALGIATDTGGPEVSGPGDQATYQPPE